MKAISKITYSAMFLALALVLPFFTGQIPRIGQAISPMHIPVLLCGSIVGWKYGLVVGFIAPLLRFMLFKMPPIMPTGITMAFELAVYGAVAGILYKKLPKKIPYIYVSLIISMISGRIMYGIVRYIIVITGLNNNSFTFNIFITDTVIKSLPAIIIHIVLIPIIVIAMKKARLIINE